MRKKNNNNKENSEELKQVVQSRVKGLGLDALFHQVDRSQKDGDMPVPRVASQSSQEQVLLDKLKENFLYCAEPKSFISRCKDVFELVSATKPLAHIGVSFGPTAIKWVELKYLKGSPLLNKAEYIPVPYLAATHPDKLEDFIVQTLRQLTEKGGIQKAFISLLIPRGKGIIKFLTLPTQDLREVEKMVAFEAEHHLPFALDDVEYDYHIVKREDNLTQFILVAVKKEDIVWYTRILEKAGIAVDAIEVSSLALHNIATSKSSQKGVTVQVNIGSVYTDINIVQEGVLRYTRGVPLGSKKLTTELAEALNVTFENAENIKKANGIVISKEAGDDFKQTVSDKSRAWADQLVHHLRRTMQYAQLHEGISIVDRLMLSGGGSQLENLNEYLKDALQTKAMVQKYPPEIQINCDPRVYQKHFQELYGLLGTTWRGYAETAQFIAINLLPRAIKSRTHRQKQKLRVMMGLILIGVGLLAVLIIPAGLVGIQKLQISMLDRKLKALKPKVAVSQELQRKIRTIEDYISTKQSSMEVLREISVLVTSDIIIERFSFEKNELLILSGEAGSHASAVNLSGLLRQSPFFESTNLKYTRKKRQLSDVVDFEISCRLAIH